MALVLVVVACTRVVSLHLGEGQRDGGGGGGEATKLRIACNHTNFSARQGTKGATLPCINVYFRWFWSGSRFMYCGILHRVPSNVSGHSILLGLLPASGKS